MSDNVAAAIAESLATHIDYDHLAQLIATRLANNSNITPADKLLEVSAIRAQLGRRGRPMSTMTFERIFVATGKLEYKAGPDSRRRYVLQSEWLRVFSEIQ